MKKLLLFAVLLLGVQFAFANNVQITNVSIINSGPGAIVVQFDLSWEKSWRTNIGPANYDGVWVFFKYRTAGGDWAHMVLTGSNNSAPDGFAVYQSSGFNKTGAVVYRDVNNMGTGNVAATSIKLGVVSALPYNIDVKAFAIEMVYVPAPTARAIFGDGDGVTESGNAFHYNDNVATNSSVVPMRVDANVFDDSKLATDGIYVYSNDTIQLTNPISSLDPFPTMKALWCMKHEINQGAYRDFLNTLTYYQQAARTIIPPSSSKGAKALFKGNSFRNGIEVVSAGNSSGKPAVYGCNQDGNNIDNEPTDGEWIACGFLTYQDVAAYLDWSGLAPMTELTFERICRGVSSAGANGAVLGEYAWGTNTINGAVYTISGAKTGAEAASNASTTVGNGVYSKSNPSGPLRSGVFATATSTRITSGASFYGIMELSGNVSEYCITLGNVAGRSVRFVPNGNGILSVDGNAQLSVGGNGFWPGMEGNMSTYLANSCFGPCDVTGSAGAILRGGSFAEPNTALAIANRANLFTPTDRQSYTGGRGVLYIR